MTGRHCFFRVITVTAVEIFYEIFLSCFEKLAPKGTVKSVSIYPVWFEKAILRFKRLKAYINYTNTRRSAHDLAYSVCRKR